jgi:hypothetical protein
MTIGRLTLALVVAAVATDLAALPYTLTHSESWSRFRVWWLAWAAVERQDRQRASLSHGGAN